MKEISEPRSFHKIDEVDSLSPSSRRRPGRGVGEKRLKQQTLTQLDTLFNTLQMVRGILTQQGHLIINESGSLLASQAHENLDQLLVLLEDFLWIINCAIAKYGGTPQFV